MTDLAGKSVVVTGGNSGIGLAIASAVAAAGADVAVWGRDDRRNAAAAAEVASCGGRVSTSICDVTVEQEVHRAFDETVSAFGRIDTMIANAGIARWFTPFAEISYEAWREVMAVNLDGAFLCLREAVRHFQRREGGGALVAVSSLAALNGTSRSEDYGASKAGLIAMMKGLAVELARDGVRVNTLVAGWVDTSMNAPFVERPGAVDAVLARSPVRRFLNASEIGAVAAFLSDPSLVAHTGDVVIVDGAYHLA